MQHSTTDKGSFVTLNVLSPEYLSFLEYQKKRLQFAEVDANEYEQFQTSQKIENDNSSEISTVYSSAHSKISTTIKIEQIFSVEELAKNCETLYWKDMVKQKAKFLYEIR